MTKLITFAGNVLVFFGDWLLSLAFDRQEDDRTERVVDRAIDAATCAVGDSQRITARGAEAIGRDPVIGTWVDVVSQRVPCPCEDCARNREMRRRAAN